MKRFINEEGRKSEGRIYLIALAIYYLTFDFFTGLFF